MRQTHIEIAEFKDIVEYQPMIGDFVIWQGWFSTWYGIVSSTNDNTMSVIFESTPRLLFTMNDVEMKKYTRTMDVNKVRVRKISCYIMQDRVWYV